MRTHSEMRTHEIFLKPKPKMQTSINGDADVGEMWLMEDAICDQVAINCREIRFASCTPFYTETIESMVQFRFARVWWVIMASALVLDPSHSFQRPYILHIGSSSPRLQSICKTQEPRSSMLRISLPRVNNLKATRRFASIPGSQQEVQPPDPRRDDSPLRLLRLKQVDAFHTRRFVAVTLYFTLWYVLSVGYNIYSKKALNLAPGLAWTTAWFQMALGLFYVVPLWMTGVRKAPKLTKEEVKNFLPVGVLHSLVHVGGELKIQLCPPLYTCDCMLNKTSPCHTFIFTLF